MNTNPAVALSAATTFSGTPTVGQLAANSFAVIYNASDQPTFVAEIDTSAFVGTLTFYGLEVNGSELIPISAHLRNSSIVASNTAINTAVALNQVWVGSIAAFQAFYVVCTAFTSGSVSVQPGLSAAPYAVSVSNTINANVANANNNGQSTMAGSAPVVIALDQSAISIKDSRNETAGNAAGSVTSTSTPIITAFDTTGFKSWSFQMSGNWTMTLAVQFSNDNFATTPYAGYVFSTATGGIAQSIVANGQYWGPILGRYMRIIPTSWTSNASGVGTLETFTVAIPEHSVYANQNGAWTVQPGNTVNTSPWLTNGANNNAVVAAAAGSVTVIKASAGVLACVVITTAGTVATNIFDNASGASGTVLLALPATTTLGQIFLLPGTAKLGITAAGSGAGAPGYTVYYS